MASIRPPTDDELANLREMACWRQHPALEWLPDTRPDHRELVQAHGRTHGHRLHDVGGQWVMVHAQGDPGGEWPLGAVYALARGERSRLMFARARRRGIEWVRVGKGAYYRCR